MGYHTPVAAPIVISAVFGALSIAAVCARFYARHLKRVSLQLDDWMLVPSLVMVLANIIPLVISACYGFLGRELPPDRPITAITAEYMTFQKCFLVQNVITTAALAVIRFTILLLYDRVFSARGALFKWLLWILYGLNAAWGIAFCFVYLFNCTPISDTWLKPAGGRGRHCLTPKSVAHVRIHAISSAMIDMTVLILPWLMVPTLKLTRRQKIAILSIFMLGAFVPGAAIGRVYIAYQITGKYQNKGRKFQIQYDQAPFIYWSVPEISVALICACLPTLRPLFAGLLGRVPLTSGQRSAYSNREGGAGTSSNTNNRNAWRSGDAYGGKSRARVNATETDSPTESVQELSRSAVQPSRREHDEDSMDAELGLELGQLRHGHGRIVVDREIDVVYSNVKQS